MFWSYYDGDWAGWYSDPETYRSFKTLSLHGEIGWMLEEGVVLLLTDVRSRDECIEYASHRSWL